MSNKRTFFIITVLRIVLFASIFENSAGQALQAEKYSLNFSPNPGTILAYNLNSRINSGGKSILGKSISLSATAFGEIDFTIGQVSTDSVFTKLTTPGIRVSLQVLDEAEDYTLKASRDNAVEVVFDKSGRIRDIGNVQALEDQNIMNFSIMDVLQNYLPAFPDRPVTAGDSWTDHRRMLIPFQGTNLVVEVGVVYTLDHISPSAEGRSAQISATCTVLLSGSRASEGTIASFEGRGNGSGLMNFQVDRRCFTDYRLDYAVDGSLLLRQAEVKLVEWPFSFSAFNSLSLIELRQLNGNARGARTDQ